MPKDRQKIEDLKKIYIIDVASIKPVLYEISLQYTSTSGKIAQLSEVKQNQIVAVITTNE